MAADPRFTQQAFNMSNGTTVRGPWNEGEMPDMGKEWDYVADPIAYVKETQGCTQTYKALEKELQQTQKLDKEMSAAKSAEVKNSEPEGIAQWSTYNSLEE